jgi:hypothetical protein
MSWQDVLLAQPAPEPLTTQNPHNSQKHRPMPVSENYGNIGGRRATELRAQAEKATDWDALFSVLDAAQTAYNAGEVTREEVESLTGYAVDRSGHLPQDPLDCPLSELLAEQPVRVRSRLLGEVVVWLADAADVPEATAEVVYRESELRRLMKMPPDQIRTMHAVKKQFDGELLDVGGDEPSERLHP